MPTWLLLGLIVVPALTALLVWLSIRIGAEWSQPTTWDETESWEAFTEASRRAAEGR